MKSLPLLASLTGSILGRLLMVLVFDSLVDFDRVPDTPPGDVPGDMKWEVRP